MNEYRGFKVGDRVEITFSSAHPIKGTITSFGDRKLGGFAEPDTMDVWISETTRYDMIYLVSHDLIKKLPKYAVGDVVRFKHKTGKNPTVVDKYGFIATIKGCDVHENICTLYEYPENYTECCFEPFDGFRIGDTVFTVKRGKGKIFAQNSHDDRQFGVRWEIDAPLYTFPKTTNLIPTEAKYKEALNKAGYAFKIDVEYVQEYVAKPYFGQVQVAPLFSKKPTYTRTAEGHLELVDGMDGCEKKYCASKFGVGENVQYGCIKSDIVMIYWNGSEFLYTLKSNSAPDNIRERFLHETVKPSAKFKIGDAVKYGGSKASISMVSTKRGGIFYAVRNDGWTNDIKGIPESALRLWVETKFTRIILFGDKITSTAAAHYSPSDYETCKWLGKNAENVDVFHCSTKDTQVVIILGIKGDDL